MKLIGMMDSPFVRRVAVTLKLYGLQFEHEQISVMRQFDEFATYNPLVKAPTLIMDDGTVLMESSLILEVLRSYAPLGQSLHPDSVGEFTRMNRIIGLALIAAEKTVQKVYEFNMRSGEDPNPVWLARVEKQLAEAYAALNAELEGLDRYVFGDLLTQADVTSSIVWQFTRLVYPENANPADYPALAALSDRVEALPEFVSSPLE